MVVSEIKLYELLKAKLGTAEAEALVTVLDTRVDAKFEDKKHYFASKDDLQGINERINQLHKTIYFTSIGNYLAIVGSILAIMAY